MVGLVHLAGVGLALGAAISSAVSNLSVRRGTERGSTYDAILIVTVVNVVILLPVVGLLYYPNYGLTWTSLLSFVTAGVLSTFIGRGLMFASINRIGASRTAPVIASWALISTALSAIFLDETLSFIHGVGVVLVVSGIGAIAWKTSNDNPDDLSRRALLTGLLLPFAAAFAIGGEPVFANVGFSEGTPALVGLAIKSIAALVGLGAYLWWRDELPSSSAVREIDVRWFVLAGVTNTMFLLGYYLALTIAPVNVVSPIIVTNTLFVVVLSALFLPKRLERVPWQVVAAAVVVVTGVLVITVYG